jgi:8-oxo-dGTP pyrophosphatase MutT (NUDIX family)
MRAQAYAALLARNLVAGRSAGAGPAHRGARAAGGHNDPVAGSARVRAKGYQVALSLLRVWWIVRRPRSRGVRCVLRRGDAVVLVRHTYGDRRWMLPGGRVRRTEDPIATARREMQQELGVTGDRWEVIGCIAARAGYRRRSPGEGFRRHSTFYVEAQLAAATMCPRVGELSDARWFPASALPADRSDDLDVAAGAGWLPDARPDPERDP